MSTVEGGAVVVSLSAMRHHPASRSTRRGARRVENDEFAGFARRIVAAHGRRVARGDVEGLAELAALAAEVDTALIDAVTGLRVAGYSWAEIGRRLGTSKQAAQQRWGSTPR